MRHDVLYVTLILFDSAVICATCEEPELRCLSCSNECAQQMPAQDEAALLGSFLMALSIDTQLCTCCCDRLSTCTPDLNCRYYVQLCQTKMVCKVIAPQLSLLAPVLNSLLLVRYGVPAR